MIEQQKFEQIKVCLDQDDYENAITLLESFIEESPEELTYYWYLGLAYLLQESEDLAQEIWLSVFLQGNLEEVKQWTFELTGFLEIYVQENITTRKLGNAKVIYDAITVINPDYENPQLLHQLIESLSNFASTLSDEKERESAIEVYLEILKLNPDDVKSWNSLALNYYYLDLYSEAEKSIQKSISLDSSSAENYHILGLILEKNERFFDAIENYLQAIKQDPKFIYPYNSLGGLYIETNQTERAVEIFHKALEVSSPSNQVQAFDNLGKAYQSLDDRKKSAFYLGYSAYVDGRYKVAIDYFEECLSICSSNIEAYIALVRSYILTDQASFAISSIEKALAIFPDNLNLKRVNVSILPIIYQDIEEIEFYRLRFCQLLTKLIDETQLTHLEEKEEALNSLNFVTNFYLGYQGYNDLDIHSQYGLYSHKIIKSIYPQLCQLPARRLFVANRKIRIGYLSSRLHTLGKIYLGWIKYHDCNKFEVYIYDVSGYEENAKVPFIQFRDNFKVHGDYFKIITGKIDDISLGVMADNLDILVFPDIGLDPQINQLHYTRLSSIQCTSWGHPMTSGSPTMDYFLSSDLMESVNGQKHYSERLIRLPNLGFSISHPDLPSSDGQRSDFQLKDDAIIYLCSQCLLKYLPQHDYIFPSIAQSNQLSQFVFFDSFLGPVITDSFIKRLGQAFTEFGLDYQQYCIFLRQIEPQKYLQLNLLADVFLDTFDFSGGLTTLDAIACGLPIVTCPGEIMRARQSYGMLQMIGVTETIVETEAEYIEIAVRLGLNQEWRQKVSDKIIANKHRLFDDKECVKGLESFFEEAVQKYSKIKLISGDLEK